MPENIQTVFVVGCGVIGMSWGVLFLSKGIKVIISDPVESAEANFNRYILSAKSFFDGRGDFESLSKNYEFVSDVTPRLCEADFVQENGPERLEFKQKLMESLDKHTRSDVVIASSSSGLPASAFIQRCKKNPGRILVGHPFNPPHLIPLVEIVPHPGTSHGSISVATEFYKSLGKTPILLNHEVPGFVSNRLQAAINNEAYSLISRGVVSAEDLDVAVASGPGLRWAITGPITINALGGGGGPEGFSQRIERLGPAIQGWEEDILKHRFEWDDKSLNALKAQAEKSLKAIDWSKLNEERDQVLLQLLAAKAEASSIS